MRGRDLLQLGLLALALATLAACSDGDSDPTGPGGAATLFGKWQGQMTATRADTGEQLNCNLTLELDEIEDPVLQIGAGPWEVVCSDGSNGGRTVIATRFIAAQVALVAIGGDPFSGCAWSSGPTLEGSRMEGAWNASSDCAVEWSGRIDLTRAS